MWPIYFLFAGTLIFGSGAQSLITAEIKQSVAFEHIIASELLTDKICVTQPSQGENELIHQGTLNEKLLFVNIPAPHLIIPLLPESLDLFDQREKVRKRMRNWNTVGMTLRGVSAPVAGYGAWATATLASVQANDPAFFLQLMAICVTIAGASGMRIGSGISWMGRRIGKSVHKWDAENTSVELDDTTKTYLCAAYPTRRGDIIRSRWYWPRADWEKIADANNSAEAQAITRIAAPRDGSFPVVALTKDSRRLVSPLLSWRGMFKRLIKR